MKMKLLLAALVSLCGPAAIVFAQQTPAPAPTPRPTPPSGPLLNKAPEMSQWTVVSRTVRDPGAAPSPSPDAAQASPGPSPGPKTTPPPPDQTLSVTKTRNIRFEQTAGIGGSKSEKWCVPDMQISVRSSGNPVVVFSGSGGDSPYTDYSRTDFGGFEWISKKNFEGTQKVMGQDCLIFRDKIKLEGDNVRSGPPPTAVACINADSRLPVALQYGEEARTYQFGPPPTDVLVLPPKVETLVNQWRKTLRQSALPPSKP